MANPPTEWNGCNNCAHMTVLGKCSAFPKRIPMIYASGEVWHDTKAPSQKGDFVWKLRQPKS